MTKTKKIRNTEEAWETGLLGREEDFVQKVNIESELVDSALALQAISIRLQKGLLDDLKDIAQIRGLGYQPLIKQILKRFVDAEKKLLLQERAAEEARKEESEQEPIKACG
jgi:predicted DNA binding CopG/RHH family protein